MAEETEEKIELTDEEVALASADFDADTPDTESSEPESDDADTEPDDDSAAESGSEGTEPVAVDDKETESETEEAEASDEVQSEFTDSDYELGLSYGLTKEDVDQLGDRSTLEKFGKIYDAQMLQQRRKPRKEKSEQASEEVVEQEQEQEEEVLSQESDGPHFDISKVDLSEYDKTTQEVFKVIDKLQGEVSTLRQRNVALEAQQENSTIEVFGRALDEIDSDFYGQQYGESSKANKIPQEQMDRRIKLAETIDTLTAGYEATGKPIPPLDVLVKNAHQIEFGDRVKEVQKSSNVQRLKKQASRKRGAGSRSTSRKVSQEPMDDEEREIQRIMEITEKPYRQMLDENG
jgi:hypothetical protein